MQKNINVKDNLSKEQLKVIFSGINNIYNHSKLGFGLIDTNLNFIHVNETLSRMFSIRKTKSIGNNVFDILPENNSSILYPILKKVLEDQKEMIDVEINFSTQKTDSLEDILLISFYPICCVEGIPSGVSFVAQNVTTLRDTRNELAWKSRLLETKQNELQNKNIAIKEIMNQIEIEKKETSHNIQSNFDNLIMPEIIKLEKLLDKKALFHLKNMKKNLLEITSSYINKLASSYTKLSFNDIKVCDLIKNGYSTKQIAELLNISEESIRSRRKIIRKKIGISHKRIKLSDFLQSIT